MLAGVIKSHALKRVQPMLVALLLSFTFLTFPPVGTDLSVNGDISLAAVLSYAHQHGMQFGPDLVYTYGPLGFLVIFYYSPYVAGIRMLTDLAVCFTTAGGLCLLAWRMPWRWRWPLLAVFVFGVSNLEPRIDVVLETGFFCWGLLSFVEEDNRLLASLLVFAAFAAFCALAKSSFLFLGPATVLVLAADLVCRGRYQLGAFMLGTFVFAFLGGWMASGQSLSNLGGFLVRTFALVSGYNEALAWEGLRGHIRYSGFAVFGLAVALIVLRVLYSFVAAGKARRALLLAWLVVLLFTVWKHSFVREDFRHPAFLFAFAPVFALGLAVLAQPQRSYQNWFAGLTALLCLVSLFSLQANFLPAFSAALTTPVRMAWFNLKAVAWPPAYLRRQNELFEACRQGADLPGIRKIVGSASIDCFGYFQSYLLYNGLNYHSAPVFQSYAACNDRLARLNEDFYLSNRGPEYVMFCLAAVDRKFPALEDPRVLRALLINYQLIAKERFFLLLKRRSNVRPEVTLLHQGAISVNGRVDLRPYAGRNLWLELELQPSLPGRLRGWLFRPGTVRLAAWLSPEKRPLLRRRAPTAGLNAGFIASPLLSRTEDVEGLLTNQMPAHPDAYSIELQPGENRWWERTARFRIYEIRNALGPNAASATGP